MKPQLTAEQIKYLNGTALQELMRLNPRYEEKHKRKIYADTIKALSLFVVEEYWRVELQGEGN
jgi:hypothetical protein